MYALKIFGEMAKTPRSVELNMTSGLLGQAIKIIEKEDKFTKEVRIWALIILNRGCMHSAYANEFMDRILKIDPPLFLDFILFISSMEDLDFTLHTKLLWQELESQAKAGSQALYQQFLDNF